MEASDGSGSVAVFTSRPGLEAGFPPAGRKVSVAPTRRFVTWRRRYGRAATHSTFQLVSGAPSACSRSSGHAKGPRRRTTKNGQQTRQELQLPDRVHAPGPRRKVENSDPLLSQDGSIPIRRASEAHPEPERQGAVAASARVDRSGT